MSRHRMLKTTSAVIDDGFGGNTPFLKSINRHLPASKKRNQQHASNYRATGRFPPDIFKIVILELEQLEATAPSSLFKIYEPKKAMAAA